MQPKPEGLAQALLIGADFIAGEPCCLVLGDNIVYGHGLAAQLQRAGGQARAAPRSSPIASTIPNATAWSAFDATGPCQLDRGEAGAAAIELGGDRPLFLRRTAVARARALKPSARGELEITDLNASYLADGALRVGLLGRGYAWFDAGNHAALLEAAEFVHVLQRRQGQLIAAPEEIAFHAGWISADDLARQAKRLGDTEYGRMLALSLQAQILPPGA